MTAEAATLIIDPVPEEAARLATACPAGAIIADARRAEAWHESDGTLVVVAGPTLALETALALAERLRAGSPRTGMVLIRRRLETPALMAALRAGVHEVVAERDLAELSAAVHRVQVRCSQLRSAVPGPQRAAAVTTVFSAKGGVGKTTVATNLAVHLARRGERVCLVDLDLAFGDVAVSLNLFPTQSIHDAVVVPPADGQTERLLADHASGLRVLAAPSDPGSAEAVTAKVAGRVLDDLGTLVDHIVIDTPPALTEVVLAAIDRSDLVAVVATLDVAALKNVRLALETLTLIGIPPDRQRLIVNRADSSSGVSPADVPGALGCPVSVTIPSSRDVPASVNAGVTLMESQPQHPVARAIAAFATENIPVHATRPTAPPTTAREAGSRSRSILRRMAGSR